MLGAAQEGPSEGLIDAVWDGMASCLQERGSGGGGRTAQGNRGHRVGWRWQETKGVGHVEKGAPETVHPKCCSPGTWRREATMNPTRCGIECSPGLGQHIKPALLGVHTWTDSAVHICQIQKQRSAMLTTGRCSVEHT